MSLKKRFGARVRDLRLARRETQDDFAEFLGISMKFLSLIERGERAPSFDTLETISERLGMTISELFDFSQEAGTRRRAKLPRRRV